MEIELEILASDIESTNYMDITDCAITRALIRAGYPTFKHGGTTIEDGSKTIMHTEDSNLRELNKKVIGMYGLLTQRVKPVDFKFTLKHNES